MKKGRRAKVLVISEAAPIWIFGMDRNNYSEIILENRADWNNVLSLSGELSVYVQRAVTQLSTKLFTFPTKKGWPDADVTLVSGTLDYCSRVSFLAHDRPVLFLVTESFGGRMRNGKITDKGVNPLIDWSVLRHSSFGGPTNFRALFGRMNFYFEPKTTTLRRTIAHIIDFGLRPDQSSEKASEASDSYTAHDIIQQQYLERKVVYRTHYCRSGWGERELNDDELGVAFGFPLALRGKSGNINAFPFVPVQIIDGILAGLLSHLGPQAPTERAARRSVVTDNQFSIPDRTWLPTIQEYLPHDWIDLNLVTDKAAKSDDAEVPTSLWDRRITLIYPGSEKGIELMRKWILRRYKHRLLTEFCLYMRKTHGNSWSNDLVWFRRQRKETLSGEGGVSVDRYAYFRELMLDAEAGIRVIRGIAGSSFWNWSAGSTLIFWRWGSLSMQKMARDGMESYIKTTLPKHKTPSRQPTEENHAKFVGKFRKIVERGYIQRDFISSLTDYFPVEKVGDFRLVYNGASSGLNEVLWAPNFWLPTPDTALNLLDYNYYSVDLDLGEMFLNFPLPKALRAVSGIDLSPFKTDLLPLLDDGKLTNKKSPYIKEGLLPLYSVTKEEKEKEFDDEPLWMRWERTWMGAKPSPHGAVRFYYFAEEIVRGDPHEESNQLRWDKVRLNLPGDPDYDPSKPRVLKWDFRMDRLAGDVITFADDLRGSGATAEHAWSVGMQVAKRLQYLGIQNAARKLRPPTLEPGAWAGAIFRIYVTEITKTISQAKWDKAKGLIDGVAKELIDHGGHMNYKQLEVVRGFLGHLALTFSIVVPFLKGFHLTLSGHLPKRDIEGWKLTDRAWLAYLEEAKDKGEISEDQMLEMIDEVSPVTPPVHAFAVPRLGQDIEALQRFFAADTPPEVRVRAKTISVILYGFADASGRGFGSSVLGPNGVRYRIGIWGVEDEDESSNWKEFENVVEAVESEAAEGNLKGAQLFLFTDNSTVESGLYKGNSSSKKLFSLIVRLRKVEMEQGAHIVVSHVAGKRMIQQGTDGVSRGQLKEGVCTGAPMLSFIPLHLGALERHPPLKTWLKSWLGRTTEFLEPEGWFKRGQGTDGGIRGEDGFWRPVEKMGTFVWTPPPAAAKVALEELRKSVLKRPNSTHAVVVPRLLTPEWRKLLHKAADLVFFLPPGSGCWPADMYEPLTIGLIFPHIHRSPWQLRGTPKLLSLARKLPKMFEDLNMDTGTFLRELRVELEGLRTVPEHVVQSVLYFKRNNQVSCHGKGQGKGQRKGRR